MTRNLKALGLALLAVLAMGALAAQGASAANHEFTSDETLTDLTASNTDGGFGNHTLLPAPESEAKVECKDAEFSGTQTGKEVDTVTLTPKYTECSFGTLPVTVDVNSCDYIFGSDTTEHDEREVAGVEIECEGTDKITVTVFASAHAHSTKTPLLNLQFGPQKVDGVNYDHGEGDVTATAHVETIHYTCAPAFLCGLSGVPSTGTTGVYDGDATVTGFKDNSDHTNPANRVNIGLATR